jgi:hypothetical protein
MVYKALTRVRAAGRANDEVLDRKIEAISVKNIA